MVQYSDVMHFLSTAHNDTERIWGKWLWDLPFSTTFYTIFICMLSCLCVIFTLIYFQTVLHTHTQSSARALAFDSYIFIGCSQNSLGVWEFELITIWHTHPHQMSKESYLRMSKFTFIHFLCVGRRHWNSTIIAMISRILRKNKTNITELQCFQSNLFY